MSRSAKVRLRWIGPSPETASTPGWSFSTPARSIVIATEGPPDANGEQPAIASFLMPTAPHDWLAVGRHFTLDGGKPVAEALIEHIVVLRARPGDMSIRTAD
jgi:hypothetical protein